MNYLLRHKSDACVGMRAYAYGATEKRWINEALAGVGVAGSLFSSIFGGSAAAKAQEEAERKAREQKAKDDAWYRRKENENYLDTAAGQNIVRQAREIADRSTKAARGAQAIGGGTDAAVALSKEQANKTVSDSMANIAAQDTARKDRIGEQKIANDRAYTQQQMQFDIQKGQNIANTAGAVGNAIQGAANIASGLTTKSSVGMADKYNTNTGVTKVDVRNDIQEQLKPKFPTRLG